MKLPVDETITNIFGEAFQANDDDKAPTLATVMQNALLNALRGDENMDGARKWALHQIAVKTTDPDADYSVEEVSQIKERIGRAYGPIIVGPAWAMIEAAANVAESKAIPIRGKAP